MNSQTRPAQANTVEQSVVDKQIEGSTTDS